MTESYSCHWLFENGIEGGEELLFVEAKYQSAEANAKIEMTTEIIPHVIFFVLSLLTNVVVALS